MCREIGMNQRIMDDAECTLSSKMNSMTRYRLIILSVLLVLATPVVQAQQEPLDGLRPVDQQVADRGALSTSLRWVQYGLNQPYNFNDLYQLPVGTESYVRRNNGLWAVFPDSMYINTEKGIYSSVPAGTVFYIGGPKEVLPQIERNQGPYRSTDRLPVDRAIESRIEASLLNHRIPASSILAEMSNGRGPVEIALETPKPAPPNSSEIRAAWTTVMPAFDFLHDDAYRRQVVMKAMLQASGPNTGHAQDQQTVDETLQEQSSVQMQHLMQVIAEQQRSEASIDGNTDTNP